MRPLDGIDETDETAIGYIGDVSERFFYLICNPKLAILAILTVAAVD